MLISLPEGNRQYIDDILNVLKADQSKKETAAKIKLIIQKHSRKPVYGLLSGLIADLECHLGIYQSEYNSYRFRDKEISYADGIVHYIRTLKKIRENKSCETDEYLYRIYRKWIIIDDEKREVEILLSDNWNYQLLKTLNSDEYYFSIVFNVSAACWEEIVYVEDELRPALEAALQDSDKAKIDSIVAGLRAGKWKRRNQKKV